MLYQIMIAGVVVLLVVPSFFLAAEVVSVAGLLTPVVTRFAIDPMIPLRSGFLAEWIN